MNTKILAFLSIFIFFTLSGCVYMNDKVVTESDIDVINEELGYKEMSPEECDVLLENKDFFLVDTHIPKQTHLPKTDEFIPYNEIEENMDKFPENKDAKIVLYCKKDMMSISSAKVLKEKGYTNVYILKGGKDGYDEYKDSQNKKLEF